MRINLEMLPKKRLLHLFGLASKAKNKVLAMELVNELAKRNHIRVAEQLIKLGQRANKRKCVAGFQMVNELWKER